MNRKTGEQSVSEKLEKAREYEKNKQKEISSEEKPVFTYSHHRIGWMNDPNGFSFYVWENSSRFISIILIHESGTDALGTQCLRGYDFMGNSSCGVGSG